MLITPRVWFWIFIENCVWHTGGTRLCVLKQQRWVVRLAKVREKECLVEQRKSLTTWRELVILYRVITKRLLTKMAAW
jgi:hypothetical protein